MRRRKTLLHTYFLVRGVNLNRREWDRLFDQPVG